MSASLTEEKLEERGENSRNRPPFIAMRGVAELWVPFRVRVANLWVENPECAFTCI